MGSGHGVLQAPDGGFYFIGATADYKGDLVSSLLKKISADGNVEWEYEYGAQERIEVLNALPLDDGGFVTTSLLPDPEGSGIISAFSTFSDSGQLINETTYRYANDNYIERALNMERMQNGDYLILVSITTYTDNYFIFREVTPGGELVKETRYLQGYRHYAPNMVMHEDGSVTVLLVLEGADGSDDITLSLLHLVP